jgi:hypothetical protein
MPRLLLTISLLSVIWPTATWAAISKQQLLELVDHGVAAPVILELVQRDCVDFDMTPEAVLELSSVVPAEILRAAIACKGSPDATGEVPAALSLSDGPAYELSQISVLAVIPATLEGAADDALTSALVESLREHRPRYRVIDPVEMLVHFEDKGTFHSSAPLTSLLTAARAQGAQAILLASASTYRRLDDPGVRIELRIVETNQGTVVWSGGGQGVSNFYNWQTAKRNAARKSVQAMP